MVTLEALREEMTKRLAVDKLLHCVEVRADTVDEALQDAAVQLDTKTVNLQYEVLEKGNEGILGFGKKPWFLKIYQDPSTIKEKTVLASDDLFASSSVEEEIVKRDADGLYYLRHFGSQIMLKVILPVGSGSPVDVKEILDEAQRPDTITLDESLIKKYAKNGTNSSLRC